MFYFEFTDGVSAHKLEWPFARKDIVPWKLIALQSPIMTPAHMKEYSAALWVALGPPFEAIRTASASHEWQHAIDECIDAYHCQDLARLEQGVEDALNIAGDETAALAMEDSVYSQIDNILSVFIEECRQPEYGAVLQFARYIETMVVNGWSGFITCPLAPGP
jgi:hypothetical protein